MEKVTESISSKRFRNLAKEGKLSCDAALEYLNSLRTAHEGIAASYRTSLVPFRGQLCEKLANWNPASQLHIDSRFPIDSDICKLFLGLLETEASLLWVAATKPDFLAPGCQFLSLHDSRIPSGCAHLGLDTAPSVAVVIDPQPLSFRTTLNMLQKKLPRSCIVVSLSVHRFSSAALKFSPEITALLSEATKAQATSLKVAGGLTAAVVGTAGAAATPAAVVGGLNLAGFTSAGVAAGSFAAGLQGPATAAGSAFAICQSVGATGSMAAAGVVVGVALPLAVGAVVVGGVTGLTVFLVRRSGKGKTAQLIKPSELNVACLFCEAPVDCLMSCDHHFFCTSCLIRTENKCLLCWK